MFLPIMKKPFPKRERKFNDCIKRFHCIIFKIIQSYLSIGTFLEQVAIVAINLCDSSTKRAPSHLNRSKVQMMKRGTIQSVQLRFLTFWEKTFRFYEHNYNDYNNIYAYDCYYRKERLGPYFIWYEKIGAELFQRKAVIKHLAFPFSPPKCSC